MRCQHCGHVLHQTLDKAVGEPRDQAWALVLADESDEWVCPVTGNEHEPVD